MAKKKYYAVKNGKKTGIFESWEDCKASVDGYPGAQYKGFESLEEAGLYLEKESAVVIHDQDAKKTASSMAPKSTVSFDEENVCRHATEARQNVDAETLLVYVDGSYHDGLKKYAFGCAFILPDASVKVAFGNGDNPDSLQQRNVSGEMLGAMYAVQTARKNGFRTIIIRYDYEGIEKWVTGEWRSKTDRTRDYATAMRTWSQQIQICFQKVPAHSKVFFNEMADHIAKEGIVRGNGIPQVSLFSELEEFSTWNRSD